MNPQRSYRTQHPGSALPAGLASRVGLNRQLTPLLLMSVAALLVSSGCTEEPEITRRLVPKPSTPGDGVPSIPTAPEGTAPPSRPATVKIDGRMLAAVVPAGGQGWFFKISGADAAVAEQAEKFETLLKTLTIEDGKPVWKTPEGWSEEGASGMRAATFTIGDPAQKLECSVIALPADDPGSDDYLLPNINRWRGQLGLASQSLTELKDSDGFHQFDLEDGTTITWVNLVGKISAPAGSPSTAAGSSTSAGKSTAAGPLLPAGHPPTGGAKPAGGSKGSPASIPEMSFDVPSGWVSGSLKPFRKISWNIDHDGRTAEFYISSLAAGGSAVGPNVNRWRGQAGLKTLSKDELSNEVDDISIGGESGSFIEISGEKQSIIGAIVVKGDTGWFFKLVGDPDVVSHEKDNVKAFLKSVKFR